MSQTFILVRFAASWPDGFEDQPRLILVSEQEYDTWRENEPPQGYTTLQYIDEVKVEDITSDALCRLNTLHLNAISERTALQSHCIVEDITSDVLCRLNIRHLNAISERTALQSQCIAEDIRLM